MPGSELFRGPWTLDGQLSWSHARENQPDTLYTTLVGEFDSGLFGVDSSRPTRPRQFFGDAATEAAFNDAGRYEFDEYELASGLSKDTEWMRSMRATTGPSGARR